MKNPTFKECLPKERPNIKTKGKKRISKETKTTQKRKGNFFEILCNILGDEMILHP